MPYQPPDRTWNAFNVQDFASYIEKFVVKGRFHPAVPEDVVGSYTVAEHIMALAYYYYPMYEEALAKLLRTMEMALKLRCEQLGISTTYLSSKKANQPEEPKPKDLNSLIDQLVKQEPSKQHKENLHGLRKLRNTLMHPKDPLLLGAMAVQSIRQILVQLNALFLPESFFLEAQEALDALKKLWEPFEQSLCVLVSSTGNLVVYESKVIEAYRSGNEWVYLCVFYPVFHHAQKSMEQMEIPMPVILVLREISIDPKGTLRAQNVPDGTAVVCLQGDKHPESCALYEQFQRELALVAPETQKRYKLIQAERVTKEQGKLRSVYWGG